MANRLTKGTGLFGKLAASVLTLAGVELTATGTEINYNAGVTPGTATASKTVILGASKEIATITSATITTLTSPTVNSTNVDAGASGTAGSVDVFPTTASKGKLTVTATDNTGNTTTSITNAAFGQATAITLTDPVSATAKIHPMATQVISADGAITIKNGIVFVTKGSAAAITLADPTTGTDDGKELKIVQTTAFAHTVTNTTGFNGLGASYDVATATSSLAGIGGAGDGVCLHLVAYVAKWWVVNTGSWGIA